MSLDSAKLPRRFRTVELGSTGATLRHRTVELGDGPAVVVEPELAGVCRSDLKELSGSRAVRSDFGHEIVGKVLLSGSPALVPGTRVCLDPHVELDWRTTAFSELFIGSGEPHALASAFVPVPQIVDPRKALFLEPLACAHHCVSKAVDSLGTTGFGALSGLGTAVLGAGNAGCLISMLLRFFGAEVTLANRSAPRLDFVRRADALEGVEHRLFDELDRASFDLVIAATSFLFESVLEHSAAVVRPEGSVVLFAGTRPGQTWQLADLDVDTLRRREGTVTASLDGRSFSVCGTYGALRRDFEAVRELLVRAPDRFPVERLISRSVSLDELAEVLPELRSSGFVGKVVVELSSTLGRRERVTRAP